MGMKESFTSFWDRVTGKTLYEVSQSVKQLEERLNMQKLDLDAANIKLASCEIDLEASNVEKEVLKIDLEDKKTTIVKQNLTISNLKGEVAKLTENLNVANSQIEELANNATKGNLTDAELDALTRKVAMQEYIAEEYKNRMEQIVNLLTTMSQEEKYSDLIRIQTNSIDENGKEMRQVYMSFNDVTVQVDEAVTVPANKFEAAPVAKAEVTGSQWFNGSVGADAKQAVKDVTPHEAEKAIYGVAAGENAKNIGIMTEIVAESVNEIADEILDLAN